MREFKPVDDARNPLVSALARSLKKVIPLPNEDQRIRELVKRLD